MTLDLFLEVRDEKGIRMAAFFLSEDAASYVVGRKGYTVLFENKVVWREGKEKFAARGNGTRAALIMARRIQDEINRKAEVRK